MSITLPARPPKASDLVVAELRELIIRDRLARGTRLPSEAELMERYGLGRVTVRESLRLLEKDGLVEIKRGPGGGVTVRGPDITRVSENMTAILAYENTTMREFAAYRWLVEPETARLAALHATDAQRKNLLELVDPLPQELGRSVGFHSLIAQASGNSILALSFRSIQGAFHAHFRPDRISASDSEGNSQAHSRIAKLIHDGDADGAETAMRRHLKAYEEYLSAVNLLDEHLVPRAHTRQSDSV